MVRESGAITRLSDKKRVPAKNLKGERLMADAPFGKWRTQTFVAGPRCDELVSFAKTENCSARTRAALMGSTS
jgi:hypothetical protein